MYPVHNRPPHTYSANGFDRAGERRADAAWIAAARAEPGSLVVPLSGLRVLVDGPEEAPRALLATAADLGVELGEASVFLGTLDGRPVFSVEAEERSLGTAHYVELRSVGTLLPAAEGGLLAYARAMAHWHARHRYCGACGTENRIDQGGHARRCPACGNETFPRTDPAVIVLVTFGDRCLLGRSTRFPPGMYSTFAGFVEPGESLEDTLARELLEEVGVPVAEIVYRSSQPWPFPQSLMLGFRARARSEAFRIDDSEIVAARWLSRDELKDEERRPVRLPGADSIARFLIDEWLAEG